jgi:putative transport protein
MEWFTGTLRHYPELAIFLTLGLGYFIGKLRVGNLTLGSVTGVLLAGLLIGQMKIVVGQDAKSFFFLLFLFAVGYEVGPQFFRALKSDGLSQVFFSIIVCLACLGSVYLAAILLGFDMGSAAGLLGGACTISSVIGMATDTIRQLGVSPDQKKALIDHIPVAFAVTYLFGTAGSAWFLASVGPKLLRVDLAAACRELEEKMGSVHPERGVVSAYSKFAVRAYRVTNSAVVGMTVARFEEVHESARIYVERIRKGDKIVAPGPETIIGEGDVAAIISRLESLVDMPGAIGPEVDDKGVLDLPAETLHVVITNKEITGLTLQEIAESKSIREKGRGVFIRKLVRGGREMPVTNQTRVDRGDVITIVGAKPDVERVASLIGYADRPSDVTDMIFVGVGVLLGGLIGAVSFKLGKIPLSLSTAGGVLIAGLLFGWLRSVHPTFGRIPRPALWFMNDVGLNAFIAIVGLSSGPAFVAGLKEAGLLLFFTGVGVTILPFVVGIFVGKYVFKMHPAIILGACAGARAIPPALNSIEDVAKSKVPALGYTVAFAIGNTLLTIWGVVIVMLLA